MRYFIHMAFRGTNYSGWQIQQNATTVQGVINDRLAKLFRQNIETIGAGRTDSGVHASQFYAHFDIENEILDCPSIVYRLNRMLPSDIVIYDLFRVSDTAHARFDATARTYYYCIETEKNPFNCKLITYRKKIPDLALMQSAALSLIKVSDFKSFCKVGSDNKTTICKVTNAEWSQIGESRIVFRITADRFLRNMVRAVVGTLLEVGEKKISLADFETIINTLDRSRAGESVEPHGLYLSKIDYSYIYQQENIKPIFFGI